MARDIFLEGHLKGLTFDEILASYADARKNRVEEIKNSANCKIERHLFRFFSSDPSSQGYMNYGEGDVIKVHMKNL